MGVAARAKAIPAITGRCGFLDFFGFTLCHFDDLLCRGFRFFLDAVLDFTGGVTYSVAGK